AKRAAIFRLDADSQTLHIQAARGLPPEYFTTVRLPVGEGVIGRAVSERRPVVISQFRADTAPSMQRDPRQHPNLAWLEREVRTILGVPLLVKSETYGGIALYYAEQRVFSAEDLGLATALGDQAALAIENARLHQAEQDRRAEAERRRRAAEGLRDILSIINSNRPLGDILDAVMTQAGHLLQTDTLAIYRLDPATRLLRIQAARGLPNEYVAALAVPLDQGMIGRAAQQRRPLGMTFATTAPPDDLYRDARNDPEQREHLAWFYRTFRAVLTAPLFIKGELYGGIVLYYQEAREFTEDDIGLAAALGDQAALAIENARLFAEALDKAALEERQRLARELHDSVSQALYGIALGARTARTLLDRDPSRVAAPLDYVLSLAEAGLAEMRALIFQLRPESLQSEGLAAGLAKAAASLRARHGIEVETDFGEEPDLPPAVKEALYRIAQEAMHNTVKHARAKKVAVTLRSDGTLATLEVRDDGVGFDPSGSFPGHLGLKSMRERAARLGGRLDITSAPETGAVIRVQIPANGA
ncbi:MAG: GAF domain-containing sensor histidine kinase, partial [Chloroflexi bacterium]|nr:GAF domain-containing sensor histidine kinase [Chloroflexota bacterium]